LVRESKKIRPEFSFRYHDQSWAQDLQIGLDGKLEIQRKIKHAIPAKAAARQRLTGRRSG
jgi:hypothetical protein